MQTSPCTLEPLRESSLTFQTGVEADSQSYSPSFSTHTEIVRLLLQTV